MGALRAVAVLALVSVYAAAAMADAPLERDQLFPGKGESFQTEADRPKLEGLLKPCFAKKTRDELRAGYARLFLDNVLPDQDAYLERTTFQDDFINSCLLSKLTEFRKSEKAERPWSRVHVVYSCLEEQKKTTAQDRCQINLVLNNFSENKELKAIVESHWKERKDGFSGAAAAAIQGAHLISQLLGALGRR